MITNTYLDTSIYSISLDQFIPHDTVLLVQTKDKDYKIICQHFFNDNKLANDLYCEIYTEANNYEIFCGQFYLKEIIIGQPMKLIHFTNLNCFNISTNIVQSIEIFYS